jgi:hypothetical protein
MLAAQHDRVPRVDTEEPKPDLGTYVSSAASLRRIDIRARPKRTDQRAIALAPAFRATEGRPDREIGNTNEGSG